MQDTNKSWFWMLIRNIAIGLHIRDPINNYLMWCSDSKYRRQFIKSRFSIDRKKASSEVTAVIMTVDPSPLFERCLAAVKSQTVPPANIEVVRNVSPFSKASQEGLDRVKTPYYVSVDDDMVLYPRCFEHLHSLIHKDDNCAEVIARLKDPMLGSILGIRMYRTEAVRAIGFYPLVGEKGCERNMRNKLVENGHDRITYGIMEGDHQPEYQPHEAFWKFRFAAEKTRYYPNEKPTFREMVDGITRYWKKTHDDAALYALAGLFDGLQSEKVSEELNYEGRMSDPVFLKVKKFLEAKKG